MMNILLTALIALSLNPVQSAAPQPNFYALTNARIVTVTGGVIERGTVVIQGDRITAVGANVSVPAGATVIDCTGLSVYPGMIDSGTRLGITEIGSDSRTQDFDEVGDLTPQAEALTAVNPNSVLIPVTRVNGVTTSLAEPQGGLFPGTAALINLHGYTPAQMLVPGGRAMVMNFPVSGRRGRFDRRSDEDIEKAEKEAIKKLNDVWDEASLYSRIDSAYAANPDRNTTPEYNPEIRALIPVVRGDMMLIVNVDRAADIKAALKWIKARSISRVVLSGVAEGWRVADDIAAAGIACIVGPVLTTPARDSDRYDKAYANAGLLAAAGVKIAIKTEEAENVRNLPYHAGFAATYGLGADAALRAVTINPAEIFGVADQIGSISVGKKANLFVTDGDPFETRTQVKHLFIEGYQVPLTSRQTELYEEFLHRNPGLQKEAN
ncbi:MAG: amidohydrolase family protein [Bacteroidetes bacterium]|nr:amidohydrolase family protein [Bacteroidota bacterium]